MKKILIIEDEKSLTDPIVDRLSRENFEVLLTKNGKEGLKSALKNHPDIIFLDILMPVMDGITVLRELRKDSWGKNAKVILLTNLSSVEKMKEANELMVQDYLIKSDISLDDIVDKINKNIC